MIRLVAGIAVLVLSAGAAWADPAEDAARTAKSAADAIILTGPLGAVFVLVVIGLVLACIVLGLVIRALWKTVQGRDLVIATLQDKRAEDAGKSSKLLAEVATTSSANIAANTTGQAELTSRMQSFADLVKPLGAESARILAGLDRNGVKLDDIQRSVGTGCRA